MNAKDGFRKFLHSPWVFLVLFAAVLLLVNLIGGTNNYSMEINYSEFLKMLDEGEVASVVVTNDTLTITPKSHGINQPAIYTTKVVNNDALVGELRAANVEFSAKTPAQPISILDIVMSASSLLLMGLMIYWLVSIWRATRSKGENGKSSGLGGFGGFGFGKSTAKQFDVQNTTTRFTDVAGQDEAKESLIEIVDILKNPGKYTSVGAEIPKGALLVGPPGTGKTLLAKAVAGEAGCPFFFVSGSAFVEMFVGTGAARVRDLFQQAAKKAPCIVFIDEIDAIGKKRDGTGLGSNDEREQTLNQLLAEMDGFDPEKGIIVLGATNRPEILDKALLRPGRFDRRIPVELPDMKGREEILQVHARKKTMAPGINLKRVADATPGASGADLANILNEAALACVRDGRSSVTQADLDKATEYVLAGSEKKSMVISPEEKRIIAYHEIGHALVALKQGGAPVRKITIIPRTNGALGFTMQADEQEHVLQTKEDLKNRLQVLVAGRAAEELMFETCTSGASNDIERATAIARNMVTRFGMSDTIGLMALDTVVDPYLDGSLKSNASEEAAAKVEAEMKRLISEAYEGAMKVLKENASTLNHLAEYLLMHENITGEEMVQLVEEEKKTAVMEPADAAM
ncbi:MAG: ATP-dependent zinc metalloprotease FtsH [Clostridiales bacterium]|nr:ATP-dependent zinc metalloprotease FtsH [Clostridiales bacterium]